MAEAPKASEIQSTAEPPQVAPVSSSSQRKVLIILFVVLAVVLLLGGLGAYFLVFSRPSAQEARAPRVVPEAIGPRSILEGLDKLQAACLQAEKAYANDLAKLVSDYAKDAKAYTPAWRAAVSNELARSNLFVRVLPDGFELALRQGEKRWLIYSRLGGGAPRISTQETEGGPPFGPPVAVTSEVVATPQVNLQEYKEPQHYFSMMLPEGFSVQHSGPGSSVRVTFSYTNGVRMTVKAMESNRGWEPLTELSIKSEQIRSGNVPAFADFRLAVTNLLDVEGGTGYEMGLVGVGSKAGVFTHTFALGGERTLLSLAVLCPSTSGKALYESVLASVRDTLRIGSGPERKSATASLKTSATNVSAAASVSVQPAEPPPLSAEEQKQWAEARALLKTSGIMRSGDAYVALVNDQLVKVNDTISVSLKNKPFKFRISAITVDEVKFEPVLQSDSAGLDKKSL